MTTGNCKHGEFNLQDGCPQCIAERRQPPPPLSLVKVKYWSDSEGEARGRDYTYYTEEPLGVGAMVEVPVGEPPRMKKAVVTEIDVPEAEIDAFRDKVKHIPVGAEIQADLPSGVRPEQQELEDGLNSEGLTLTVSDEELSFDEEVRQEEQDIPIQGAMIAVNPLENADVIKLYNEAVKLEEYADARVIESLTDLKGATGDLNIIRKLRRTLEALRKEWLKPLKEHTDSINADFATLMAPIIEADKVTAGKMLDFDREQTRIRREQEEVNRLRIEAAEKEAALNGGEITESVDLIKPVAEVPDYVRTDAGNAGMRDNWKWRVIDKALIPVEYMKPDDGVITPIVKASKGKVPIPGIEQYNEPIIAVRR